MKRFFILAFVGLISIFQLSFSAPDFILYHEAEPQKSLPSGTYVTDQVLVKFISSEVSKRSLAHELKE